MIKMGVCPFPGRHDGGGGVPEGSRGDEGDQAPESGPAAR